MSRAVFVKTLRDALPLIVLATLGILIFEILMTRILIEAFQDFSLLRQWLDRPLVKMLVRLAIGADLSGNLTPTTLFTFGFAHPLMFACAWGLIIALGSGVIAGEIGRGTADLMLTLPVSRVAVYTSTSVVWAVATVPLSVAPWVGLWVGEMTFKLPAPLELDRLAPIVLNLWVLHLSVAGVTMMISSLTARRSITVGLVLGLVLASDLLNLVAQFWKALGPLSYVGFLHYYRPLPIVQNGHVPPADLGVLLAVGGLAWLMGLWYFSRRDIPAI